MCMSHHIAGIIFVGDVILGQRCVFMHDPIFIEHVSVPPEIKASYRKRRDTYMFVLIFFLRGPRDRSVITFSL